MKFSFTKSFDITRALNTTLITYPGDPSFTLKPVKRMPVDSCDLSSMNIGLHNGTHTDAPSHFVAGGATIDTMSLEKFCGDAVVLDLTSITGLIEEQHLIEHEAQLSEGIVVLVRTRNSLSDGVKFDEQFCAFTEGAAIYLASRHIKAVCVDGPSVDKFHSGHHPAHIVFFDAGITIFENVNLRDVTTGEYVFFGFPLKIGGAEASPVRAVLFQ